MRRKITLEEEAILEAMRKRAKTKWRVAREIPYASQEQLAAIRMVLSATRLSVEAAEKLWGA